MRHWRRPLLAILGLALVAAGWLLARHQDASPEPEQDESRRGPDAGAGAGGLPTASSSEGPRLYVLAINGGGSAEQNYKSHLLHLQGMVDLLHAAKVPDDHITVLSGDGADPSLDLVEQAIDLGPQDWRLFGTDAEKYLSNLALMGNSSVTGATLYPATRGSLSIWLMTVGQQLQAGDTLLLYVTDHGASGAEPDGNRIVLWGAGASLSVRELRDVLETLDPEVRIVALMSQCYSGGFAKLADLGRAGEPTGRFCGFFSTTADRKSYGCYPETRDNPKVGHSFAFLQALPAAMGRLSVAHELSQEFDDTPDVPLRTSDVYLGAVLAEIARSRKVQVASLVDEVLQSSWGTTSVLGLAGQRLDRLSERFGLPRVRTRFDLAKASATIQEAISQLGPLTAALDKALAETNNDALHRFLEIRSDLKLSLDPVALKAMDLERRVRFGKRLLYDLATFSGPRSPAVKQDRDAILRILFRMRVRMAALARMQTVLDGIAGERYLAGRPTERAALQRLLDCEDLDLKLPGTEWVPPGPAMASVDQDLAQLHGIVTRGLAAGLAKRQAVPVGAQASQLRLVPYRGAIPQDGKPLLLFFWATWCRPCKQILPALSAWARQQAVTILAVTDEDASTLDHFFTVPQDFPALIARDPDHETMSTFGVRAFPSFALLDSEGRLAGPVTSSLGNLPTVE